MNYGLHLDKEKEELLGDEWKFGALSPDCIFAVPEDKRLDFLPQGELQNIGEEKSGCVSRGYLNILETKLTYGYRTNLMTLENKQWLKDNGYIENDRVILSDAFIEILSGTTRQGNSMKAPAQAIHTYGLIPKKLLPQLNTFDEHYNPARITDELKALGVAFLEHFTVNYEQVFIVDVPALLERDSMGVALYAWQKPINGEYKRIDFPFNHFVMAVKIPMTTIFDNYLDDGAQGDFLKKLAPDYRLYEYGYRIFIASQKETPKIPELPKESTSTPMTQENKPAILAWLVKTFLWLFNPKGNPPEKPVVPVVPPKKSRITDWAMAIEKFESGGDKNALSYRRNNPGNLKNASGKFKVYATYEAGFADLCNYLIRACTNEHAAYVAKAAKLGLKSSGDLTMLQFIQVYTGGDSELIQKNYTNFILKQLAVTADTKIKTLL